MKPQTQKTAMDTELTVFTLNCWGIPLVSKDRRVRMAAIAEAIVTGNYDVVCLQEVWTDSDFHLIKEKVSGALPHAHYFYSGVAGSGICVLSRHSMQSVFFHQWAVNGYIHKFQHGDWFGGKGVGLCRLKIRGFNIDIYTAHLHAEYNKDCDEYLAHRVLQAFDTAQFIQLTSTAADLIILAGDLNTEPTDVSYRIIVSMTPLIDPFTQTDTIIHHPPGTDKHTCNSYINVSAIKAHCSGTRIDYILYRAGPKIKAQLKRYELPLPERIPDRSISYSDHEAVAVTLQLKSGEDCYTFADKCAQMAVLRESLEICDKALHRLIIHRRVYCFFSFLLIGLIAATFATSAPFGYQIIYDVARFVLTGFLCYMIIMATLWNNIERSGVRAGKLNMEITKLKLEQKDCRY